MTRRPAVSAAISVLLATSVFAPAAAQSHDPHAGHHPEPAPARTGDHADHVDHVGHAAHAGHAAHDAHADHAVQRPPAAAANTQDPRTPIPALTDADRAAAFPALRDHGMHHPDQPVGRFSVERLEAWDGGDDGDGQAWEAGGWYGGDLHRLWLRTEGEREAGRTTSASLELLYGRSVSPWWDLVAGIRHDAAPGAAQDWLAVGAQGLAPYLFEVAATAHLGASGRSRLVLEAEYDLLLGSRLVLQPALEATLHGQADPGRGVGQGLSTLEAGLRLRYQLHRQFAPYIGVAHERSFGRTRTLRDAGGGHGRETRVVAGVRFWF